MSYKLSQDVWLAQQVDRCKGVLSQNMDYTREYSLQELLSLCRNFGLDYTGSEYQVIGQQLLAEGFLVTV